MTDDRQMNDMWIKPENGRSGDTQKEAILVLGMHRSGTSTMAAVAAALGGQAPLTLMEPKPDNAKGFWESLKVADLNDEILASAGTEWSDWRTFDPEWFNGPNYVDFLNRAVALINSEYDGHHLIMLKDPRICRIYPFWKAALLGAGYLPRHILIFRSPIEVADSLASRDGIPMAHTLLLWLHHNLEIELETREECRKIVYWPSLVRNWRHEVDLITEDAHIKWPGRSHAVDREIDNFFDPTLIHHLSDETLLKKDGRIHDTIVRCFNALLTLADSPRSPSAFKALDKVRAEFSSSVRLLGPEIVSVELEVTSKKELPQTLQFSLARAKEQIMQGELLSIKDRERISELELEIKSIHAASKEHTRMREALDDRISDLTIQLSSQIENSARYSAELNRADILLGQSEERLVLQTRTLIGVKAAEIAIRSERDLSIIETAQLNSRISELEERLQSTNSAAHSEITKLQKAVESHLETATQLKLMLDVQIIELMQERRKTILSPITTRARRQILALRQRFRQRSNEKINPDQ